MTLDILICTMASRLHRVPTMLLPVRKDVHYLVSCQYQDVKPDVPAELEQRQDVQVLFLQGVGLSHNRNNALRHATNDVLLIADDDERFDGQGLTQILRTYEEQPDLDIALFRVKGMSKYYPSEAMPFQRKDFRGAYCPASVEISMRRTSVQHLHFNPHFGLGSEYLSAGEEQVFLYDALMAGLRVQWFPILIAETSEGTTGERFLSDTRVQRSKGATFCYLFGRFTAYYLCVKEAIHYLVYKQVNPFNLMHNMRNGINYAQALNP